MLKKIYEELVLIRKELQAIRGSKEFYPEIFVDGKVVAGSIRQAIHDNDATNQGN